jgi:hypothetical protein
VGPVEDRPPRLLAEVEVAREVAEDRLVLTDVGTGSGRPVGLRVDARPPRKSSSMNFRYASKLSVWWST